MAIPWSRPTEIGTARSSVSSASRSRTCSGSIILIPEMCTGTGPAVGAGEGEGSGPAAGASMETAKKSRQSVRKTGRSRSGMVTPCGSQQYTPKGTPREGHPVITERAARRYPGGSEKSAGLTALRPDTKIQSGGHLRDLEVPRADPTAGPQTLTRGERSMNLTKLGRFEIIREIGKGAMGQVFLANDPKIERKVAIKTIVLPPGTSEEEARETSQRFLREAQAAGKLLHPNIVTIFDVGEEAGVSFIAMEYIEGETLEKYTRPENLLSLRRVQEIVEQAASALDYAHQNHVIHRDIKPANLMMLKGGVLKVTDYGLAKNPSANLTQAGVLLGTPSYMSPEQIQGYELDGRSDLFSLGVVLYELLTGVRPFEGDSISTIIYRVLCEDPRPPAAYNTALPPEINGILERALDKEPDRRYQTGSELVAELAKAFVGLPPATLSRPLPAMSRPPSGARTAQSSGTLTRQGRG